MERERKGDQNMAARPHTKSHTQQLQIKISIIEI